MTAHPARLLAILALTAGAARAEAPARTGTLRVHVISTQGTYVAMGFDVFGVESRAVVAFGKGADESIGQPAPSWDLPPGLYKIVRSGEPFDIMVDFATVELEAGEIADFVVVVDPDTLAFRGSGPATGELPGGTRIAGVLVTLHAGGALQLTDRHRVVGGTGGLAALLGLFGHFGLLFDRDAHFLSVNSDLHLTLSDPAVASIASTQDRWEAAALYAFHPGNRTVGPYARASFSTRVFPGYLYLDGDEDTVTVTIRRPDGTTDTAVRGGEANQDDLRIKVARPFAPLILQEEVGANLKAVNLDLILLKLAVATRLGFGFRQGFTNRLLVASGEERGSEVELVEVEDESTLGPVLGADATLTFARWLFGSARFGMLVPLVDTERAGDSFGSRLLFDLSGTGGLKMPALTSFLFASFDYTFRLEKDGYIAPEVQFDHTLMGRLNVTLF